MTNISRITNRSAKIRRQIVDLLLLRQLLHHGEQCGWELALAVEQFAEWPTAAGTVLPLMWRLQRRGLVRARWITVSKRRRKQYRITAKGEAEYKEGIAEIEKLLQELRIPNSKQ